MSNAGLYEEVIKLPSQGLLYSKEECPDGNLTIRAMVSSDEAMIQGAGKDNIEAALNKMISGCIVSGWKANLGRMCNLDRLFVLYRLRILTYGGEYRFGVTCPRCDEDSEYAIDLAKLPVTVMKETTIEPVHVELPMSGVRVGWRFLRCADDQDAAAYQRRSKSRGMGDDPLGEFMSVRRIVSVDGEEGIPFEQLLRFVRTMHARDKRYWEKNIEEHSFGVDTMLETTCRNRRCGKSHIIEMPVSDDFFRPRLDNQPELSKVYAGNVLVSYNNVGDESDEPGGAADPAPRADGEEHDGVVRQTEGGEREAGGDGAQREDRKPGEPKPDNRRFYAD
jgi:hypothetical protein